MKTYEISFQLTKKEALTVKYGKVFTFNTGVLSSTNGSKCIIKGELIKHKKAVKFIAKYSDLNGKQLTLDQYTDILIDVCKLLEVCNWISGSNNKNIVKLLSNDLKK